MTVASTLVTGASGFIGRHVVRELERREAEVVAVEHRWKDVTELRAMVGGAAPARCIHLGWYADPADYLRSVRENAASLASTLALVDFLRSEGCDHLVVSGTSAEYGPSGSALRETDPPAPTTVYGSAKSMCGSLLLEVDPPPFPVAWARLFNVIGPGEHPDRVVPAAVAALQQRRDFPMSTGTQIRDYIDVRDVAHALVEVCERRLTGAMNVCTGIGTSLRDLLGIAAEVYGGGEHLLFGRLAPSGVPSESVVGDPATLSRHGWRPKFTLRETLAAMSPAGAWRGGQEDG